MRKIRQSTLLLILSLLFCNSYKTSAQLAPDTVRIGSYIISLHDINFHNKEYVIRFWVWMSYSNPKFDFTKRVEVPQAKEMVVQDIMTNTDSSAGKIYVLMKLKCVMKQSWSVHNFPFDKQKLEINIENSEFDARNLVFVSDESGSHYDPDLVIDGWDIMDFKTFTKTNKYQTDFGDDSIGKDESFYASYNLKMDIGRSAWGLFFKMFIGMYIAFMISFISFYVDHEEVDPRFALPVGGLFGSIGNKYIIDNVLPENTSFTLVDSLHALTFISIFLTLAVSVYTLRLFDMGEKDKARRIDVMGRNVIIGLYVGLNAVLIILAIVG
ncbi:MAG: hypothetical protein H7329_02100 [Opitutaceae bacterium]|nr:hypothetical protein [Cytophagales bacterium]